MPQNITLYLDDALIEKIDKVAERQKRTRSNLISILLEEAITKVK